jgi:undecaprenyl-diphosphatase
VRFAALLLLLGCAAEPTSAAVLLVLALVQGLTEFLPVSSSGHLVLAQSVLGLTEPALTVDVALHLGTLVAVVIVYRRDVGELLAGLGRGAWREPLLIVLATLPSVAVGLLAKEAVERSFESAREAAWGLLGTALLLVVGEWYRRKRAAQGTQSARLDWRIALAIGIAQAVAISPGISRSGATIATGLVLGLTPFAAARFSFLLSIPAICGAAVLQLSDSIEEGLPGGWPLVWAVCLSGVVGWASLRVLIAFLGRGAFAWFAVYCCLVGSGYLLFGPR